ncbi:MAG TPA: adenylate/guanylate cyclase domain-containing protein [Candidatus Nanopelagicales bacterium]|nr:adenylate/guanylate cyclase domain-containing protein [Candidatus Nanopelagicales bacterium]
MECARCGTLNDPGRKFCRQCGDPLVLICAVCGAQNQPGDRFCGECGAPLPVAGPAARPSYDDGDATERRLVSVLFVDLVGFTTFSEGRDAEDVRAMLSRYFDIATEAVVRHGGTVEKFIGDAVMAVWGTPIAHEDDAERAVRSALEIVDRVAVLGQQMGIGLQARGGVLTGEAVALLDATDQGFVTGDLVNTASRLQSAADPGGVLVGDATYRSTANAIAYEPVDPLSLKGKSEAVSAWRAVRVLSERRGVGRGDAPEPPFVGREEQLRTVEELLHATGREGRPRLVHVSGVAGIGKSRLVWELRKYVDGLSDDVFWHQGRCPAYGDGVSFWALAEMVRGRARILEADDELETRAKLRACLAERVADPDERAWLEPALAHLLGLDAAPPGDRDDLFGAWRRFFECVAERGTTVLVVEELHWADPGLMDFLESVLEWSRSYPILVLTLARPELDDRRPSWGVGVRNGSTVHLNGLSDDEVARLVTGFVGGLPASAVDELVRRAEGVPLYAVETVRMLVDRGVLEQAGDRYRAVGDAGDALAGLDVPETLHALVAARLDALPEAERWLVQDASVAGFNFTLETVCAVAGREPQDVERSLRALVRKEVLDQDVDPRSPERGQYRFVQSVIREVAYSTLSKAARRTKHLACARRFAALDEEELAGVVAHHYLDAYRADPSAADADDVADQALVWVTRAADRALALGSPQQALEFTRQALELTDDPRRLADLHVASLRAGRSRTTEGRVLYPDLAEAVRLYRSLNDVRGVADALIEGGRMEPTPESQDLIEQWLDEVLAELGDSEPARRARLHAAYADRGNTTGRRELAIEHSETAIVLAQSLDDEVALRESVAAHAWALLGAGREYEARLLWDGAVALARRNGSPAALGRVLLQASTVAFGDDPISAITLADEATEYLTRTGTRWGLVTNLSNLVEACVDAGRWETAEDALARLHQLEPTEDENPDAVTFGAAMLVAHRGEPSRALDMLAAGPAFEDMEFSMHTWALRVRALAHHLGGDDAAALADVRESLARDPRGANSATSYWVGVQAACTLHDRVALGELLADAVTFRGRASTAVSRVATAALLLLATSAPASDRSRAARYVREALDIMLELDLPLDHAAVVLAVACAGGPSAPPPADLERARTYLAERGAVAMQRLYAAAGL